MFGFKRKIREKDIVISNLGFHLVFNSCRDKFDDRISQAFSDKSYQHIIKSLLETAKDGSFEDELYNTVINSFSSLSGRAQFQSEVLNFTKALNNLRGEEFEEARKRIIESKFSVNNIQESIANAKENGLW
jgi:hypothetical protein